MAAVLLGGRALRRPLVRVPGLGWVTSDPVVSREILKDGRAFTILDEGGVFTPAQVQEIASNTSGFLGITGLIALGTVIWTAIGWVTFSRRAVRAPGRGARVPARLVLPRHSHLRRGVRVTGPPVIHRTAARAAMPPALSCDASLTERVRQILAVVSRSL